MAGTKDLYEFYELNSVLGQGQFGVVNIATHLESKAQFAVKSVLKEKMTPIEVTQQRREIEVLKMCQHTNIIKLTDLFETCEHYYVVMEYMRGKDLFDYLQARGFNMSELMVKKIVLQLILGVRYLHSFGIVHRDLKLENVMMSDMNDGAIPKIVDFGLSKIIGPNEKANEPFGTVGYVAPEVLKQNPYSFSCDVWSIGCIFYALISGSLPFDSSSEKETKRMTVEEPVVYTEPAWKTASAECKDIIMKLLAKDPTQRITLDKAVQHKFFD